MWRLQGFRKARVLRISQSEQHYPNLTRAEDVNHVGKKTCLVFDSISTAMTFTAKACQKSFKIKSAPLICNLENVLWLLKCKVCVEVPYVGKAKTNFRYRFNNSKSKHRAFRKSNWKVPHKLFHTHYCLDGIAALKIGIL